jgi:hypothetical protein
MGRSPSSRTSLPSIPRIQGNNSGTLRLDTNENHYPGSRKFAELELQRPAGVNGSCCVLRLRAWWSIAGYSHTGIQQQLRSAADKGSRSSNFFSGRSKQGMLPCVAMDQQRPGD